MASISINSGGKSGLVGSLGGQILTTIKCLFLWMGLTAVHLECSSFLKLSGVGMAKIGAILVVFAGVVDGVFGYVDNHFLCADFDLAG